MPPALPPSGAVVLHPTHGVCRVVGCESVWIGGERINVLAIALAASHSGVIKIPVSRLPDVRLLTLTDSQAQELLERGFTPPTQSEWMRRKWRQCSRGGLAAANTRRSEKLLARAG